MPGTMSHVVERAIVWTTIVATIAWSIGLSFLIKVPSAHAAVTATAPATDAIGGYMTSIRNDNATVPIAALTLTGSASETLTSIAVVVNSISGVDANEIASVALYSNTTACTNSGATLTGNSAFKLCGMTTPVNIGSATTISADADGNPGNGIPIAVTIGTGGSTWIIVISTASGGSTPLDNTDQFTVVLGTNAITTSANSPTITAYTSDTFTRTTAAADATAPTCAGAGGPPDGQVGAPADALIDRTCGETLISSRVNTTNVTLKACTGADQSATTSAGAASTACATKGNSVCATVTLNGGTRIECTPAAPLATNTWHEFSIGTGVLDTSGNALATAAIYRFKTGAFGGTGGSGNLTGPNLISQSPAPNATGVGTNANLTATFCLGPECNMKNSTDNVGAMNRIDDVANVSVKKIVNGVPSTEVCTSGTACVLTWASGPRILTVNPAANLEASTSYDFCVRSTAKNQQDIGIPGDRCIRFTTGTGADVSLPALRTTAPTIPANGASAPSPSPFDDIRVFFSKDMDPATLSLSTVRLCTDTTAGTPGCEGSDTRLTTAANFATRYDNFERAFRISPVAANAIAASTRYCIEVIGGGSGAKDTVGNAFETTSSSTTCFTTGAATDLLAGGPQVSYCDADNNKLVVHFNEPIRSGGLISGGNIVAANVAVATVVSGNTTNMNLNGKPALYNAEFRELEIQNLGFTATQQVKVTVTNAVDLAGNAMDTTNSVNVGNCIVQLASATGGNLGSQGSTTNFQTGTNFATFWESPQRCEPRTRITNKSTPVECEFKAPAALAAGSTFTLTFPDGFTYTGTSAVDGTTGATRAVAASKSFLNTDLNGPAANAPVIQSASCVAASKTCTVTTGTAAIASGDMVRFELERVTTPTTAITDKRITIIVKDENGVKQGETINPAPFSIQTAGARSISGKVCKSTTADGDCGDGAVVDVPIASMKVFCDQMGGFVVGTSNAAFAGHQETTTDANGDWSISGLSEGQYGCGLPPDPTTMGNVMGGNAWKNVTVSSGNATNVDFDFTNLDSAGQSLAVTLTGAVALASKQLDVFCHAGASDFQFSAPVMKAVTLDGSGNGTATMKLLGGKTYDCGVGPHMDFSAFSGGGPPPTPTFDFLPPAHQRVNVVAGTNPAGITFTLTAASNTITVNVCDGGTNDSSNCGTALKGTGIANVYVNAMPLGCFDATSGEFKQCFGGFAQTNSSGIATLKVTPGEYEISANGPGLPPGDPVAVTVLKNGTVQQKGATVTQVTIKLAKSSTTISGQILDESGNGIQYAGVNGEKIVAGGSCTSFTPAGGWRNSPTDSSGNYTLYVGNGTWNVRAFSPTYGEVGCTTVIVSDSTSATGKNIQATAGNFGTITGTCPDGAFVNAFGTSGGNFAQCSEGTYSMKVKTGTYTVECFAHGAGPCGRSTGQAVSASGTTTANFSTSVTTGTVSVTITGITDAFVDVRDSSGNGNGTSQNTNGVYTVKVVPGTYTLRGGSPKYGDLCSNQSVTVTANTTTSKTCTPPANLRTVTGRVTDGTSNVAGATLTLSDSNGKMFNATTGAQDGSTSNVSLTNVPDGTYTLRAAKKGYEPGVTTATVSGGNLTLTSPLAMTSPSGNSGANGETVTISTQSGGSTFTGEGRVVCTKGSGTDAKIVVADIDGTTGQASADLSNGTWSVTAIGDNGKTSAASTVTVSGGTLSGSAPTLAIDTAISGFTAKSDSGSMTPTVGGVITSETASPVSGSSIEVNVPAGALSTTDSSTGKVEIKLDPSAAAVDPGADLNFVGQEGIEITPSDANGNAIGESLTGTVKIEIPYTDADVSSAGVLESALTVGALNTNGEWETFPTTIDTVNNILTVEVSHFSTFGILGAASGGSPSVSDATPPAAPTSIVASGTASAVTITWTDPSDSDLDSIEVLRNNPPTTAVSGTPLSRVAKGTARFVDSTVSAGKVYTYILRSKDRSNNTRNSGEITVATPASTAAAPSAGTVTAPPAATTTAPPAVTTPAAPAATAPGLATIGLSAGDLVRSPNSSTMYLVGADGKRYVFPNEVTYKSWYKDFSSAKSIAGTQMSQLPLGGVVTVRPGTWLVKIESDPKVYAVEPGGSLRWIETEERAQTLYGMDWNKQIIDIPVSYWPTYAAGTALGANRHPTGTVVRSGSQTYYIDAGKKRLVSSDVFSSLGFQDRFVKQLSSTVVYEDGPALPSTASLRFAGSR